LGKKILKVFPDMKRMTEWHVLMLFVFLSVILRFFSFFPSVIDHDESTYFEIAREMLGGKLLYVDLIDIKPPGIFMILAGFQAVFGHSLFVIRLLVAIWISLTAFMVYKSGKLLFNDARSSLAAGIIYIFLISTWSFYGISTNPEIFFNLFTILALFILLKGKGVWKFFLAGLLGGIGFIVKYFVLLDFAVFILFFLFLQRLEEGEKRNVSGVIVSLILAGIGFLLPFALCNLYYLETGHFDAFVNIIYMSPQRYPSPINPIKMPLFLLDFQLRYFPVFFFFYYALIDWKYSFSGRRGTKLLLILWTISSLVAVVISGNHYGHYTIQLMLPVSLMAGAFFHPSRTLPRYLSWINTRKAGLSAMIVITAVVALMKLEYFIRQDTPREIAQYLKPKLGANDTIYTGNYHHILYYLLKKDSPTPYVHRSILYDNRHIKALNIDQNAEFERIINMNPVYILTQKEYPAGRMKDFIMENYLLEKDFGNTIRLYRREEKK
jgi:4-amino-4-deoxy-L-arabinose transferase-like glycosyltransferase